MCVETVVRYANTIDEINTTIEKVVPRYTFDKIDAESRVPSLLVGDRIVYMGNGASVRQSRVSIIEMKRGAKYKLLFR